MNIIVILSLAASAFAVPSDGYELQFVTFVHRHGDRSPTGTYPNDPYRNESLWNNGWGELTTTGKQRAYDLGKWLRKRYATFLPEIYNKKDFEVQSTDVSRTLMSAYLALTGLYEPKGSDVWNPSIKWQPIPVHTIPRIMDKVLAAGKLCPRREMLFLQLLTSKELASKLNPIADALLEVVKHAGYEGSTNVVANFLAASAIYDSLNVQHENGLELPKWSKPYFPQPLQDVNTLSLRLSTYNRPLQRLTCGLLVQDILEHFKSKSRGTLSQKMWQYSAHDITIVGLSQCLGFNKTDVTPYASALILELSEKDNQHYVQVLYKANDQLKTLTMPGCTEYCPLTKFEELVTPVIPEDWEAECRRLDRKQIQLPLPHYFSHILL